MLSINFDCDSAPLLAAVAIVVKHAFLLQSCSLGVGQVLIYESMHSFAEKVTTFRLMWFRSRQEEKSQNALTDCAMRESRSCPFQLEMHTPLLLY